jgi:hypothetical protein
LSFDFLAVSGDIEFGTAGVVLVELLIGIVDGTGAEAESHRIVAVRELGEPDGGIDQIQLAVDVFN